MCGIAGLLHFEIDRTVDSRILQRMTNVLSHRGPDGENYYVDRNIGLGHRRLAVIDLSTGAQPMICKDQNLVIVFNGEIYNYIELKEELKALGHTFNTSSDTEVILNAYEEWGFDCQNKFNGMWAFAIWDARRKHLFLSRDRIGEKPLHFAVRDNSFLFGSEIKSILAYGSTYEAANQLLHIYLSLGYIPAPYTVYEGIYKLMPGHFLVVKDGKVNERAYWDLPCVAEEDMRNDAEAIYEEFDAYLSESVKIRMRSDVPYGVLLSGGLDSSSIVAAMSRESHTPVETFTIGFAEKGFDERTLARQVAEYFRTNHHEQVAESETLEESVNTILRHFDEPFGDASAMPVGLVSRLARQRVTMVLTGDGGDEVLSGYTSYVAEKRAHRYRHIPVVVRAGLHHLVDALALCARNGLRYRLNRISRFLHLAGAHFEERFIGKLSLLDPKTIRRLIRASVPQISIEEYLSEFFRTCPFTDPFYRLMYFNLKVSLPDDMLTKVDRMSMAYSLEARVPFLDYRLIELCCRVHKDIKLPGCNSKNLLKQTVGKALPPALLKAPKMSFSVPLREWFKQNTYSDLLSELKRNECGLNGAVVAEVVEATRSGRHDYGDFIWRALIWKRWMNK